MRNAEESEGEEKIDSGGSSFSMAVEEVLPCLGKVEVFMVGKSDRDNLGYVPSSRESYSMGP